MNHPFKSTEDAVDGGECLFCRVDAHPQATEGEKRFMYCHLADMARVMYGVSPAEFAAPCRAHGHVALEAAPRLGEAMGMAPEVLAKVREVLDVKRAEAIASAGGGSG